MKHKSIRSYFNRKAILIMLSAIVIVGAGAGVGLLKASANPTFCGTCHIIKPYYQSWNEGSLLDHQHAEANVTCQECHHSTIPEKAQEGFNYIIANYVVPLEGGPDGGRDFCLDCHSENGNGSSWAEIRAATDFEEANPHDSHNGEQECNECHNMHQPSQVMCSQCHFFKWVNDLDIEAWATDW